MPHSSLRRSLIHASVPFLTAALAAQCPPGAANTWYVDAFAAPGGNGLTWATAFDSLDAGLAAAGASAGNDEIRVAEGTYRPAVQTNPPDPRSATFSVPSGTWVRGAWRAGQSGSEPAGSAASTILSGDIGAIGTYGDNTYHVVTFQGGDPVVDVAGLRDLTVRDGYAVANPVLPPPYHRGGGIHATSGHTFLRGCLVLANGADIFGAGLWTASALDVVGCTFEGNAAGNASNGGNGGGLFTSGISRIFNTRFVRNVAYGGAGLCLERPALPSVPHSVVGCLFQFNSCVGPSDYGGAALLGTGSGQVVRASFMNCTLTDNAAGATNGSGGGIAFFNPTGVTIDNSIVWNNTAGNPTDAQVTIGLLSAVRSCTVQGGYHGGNNILTLPPMLNRQGIPNTASPVIDIGLVPLPPDIADCDCDGITTEVWPVDLAGRPRTRGAAPDQGVFEVR